jgi:hypothetical protein
MSFFLISKQGRKSMKKYLLALFMVGLMHNFNIIHSYNNISSNTLKNNDLIAIEYNSGAIGVDPAARWSETKFVNITQNNFPDICQFRVETTNNGDRFYLKVENSIQSTNSEISDKNFQGEYLRTGATGHKNDYNRTIDNGNKRLYINPNRTNKFRILEKNNNKYLYDVTSEEFIYADETTPIFFSHPNIPDSDVDKFKIKEIHIIHRSSTQTSSSTSNQQTTPQATTGQPQTTRGRQTTTRGRQTTTRGRQTTTRGRGGSGQRR